MAFTKEERKTYMRKISIVMTKAWEIRAQEKSVENPLKESWKRVNLAFHILNDDRSNIDFFAEAYEKATYCRKLRQAIAKADDLGKMVEFAYLKADQSIRVAFAKPLTDERSGRKKDGKKGNSANGKYFDVEKNSSRTYKIARLITTHPIKFVACV